VWDGRYLRIFALHGSNAPFPHLVCGNSCTTMHAGVECGIMAAKIDGLDCVSFGPDIIDIHTVKEKHDIASTQRIWQLITDVLKQLA